MQRVHKNPANKTRESVSYNSHTLFLPRLPLSMPSFPIIPSPSAISFSQFQTENNVVGKEATSLIVLTKTAQLMLLGTLSFLILLSLSHTRVFNHLLTAEQ